MNDDRESALGDDESELLTTMDLLKGLEPTLASRVKNREAIAGELAKRGWRFLGASQPWWGRSISVPLPAALAVMLFLASALIWLFASGSLSGTVAVSEKSDARTNEGTALRVESQLSREHGIRRLGFRASETYLCGIGRINHESIYELQE